MHPQTSHPLKMHGIIATVNSSFKKKKFTNTNKNNYACVQVFTIFTIGTNKRHFSKFKKKNNNFNLPNLFSTLPKLGQLLGYIIYLITKLVPMFCTTEMQSNCNKLLMYMPIAVSIN